MKSLGLATTGASVVFTLRVVGLLDGRFVQVLDLPGVDVGLPLVFTVVVAVGVDTVDIEDFVVGLTVEENEEDSVVVPRLCDVESAVGFNGIFEDVVFNVAEVLRLADTDLTAFVIQELTTDGVIRDGITVFRTELGRTECELFLGIFTEL